MEILLALSITYLILTLIYSSERFIIEAALFIIMGCFYTVSLLASSNDLFLTAAAILTAIILPLRVKLSFFDIVKVCLIAFTAIFWLGTSEFVDGYAYSQLFVALGVALASILIFAPEKRQILAFATMLLSYGLIYTTGSYIDLQSTALSLCLTWIIPSVAREKRYDFSAISLLY
ncbi:MAG: hypothetical protein K2J89_06290 [Clostridia bacterium]|nr:hypothetical protein [Clostridia bacterium]